MPICPATARCRIDRACVARARRTAHRRRIIGRAIELGTFTQAQLAVPTHSAGKRDQYANEIEYRLSWALHLVHKDDAIEKLGGGFWKLLTIPGTTVDPQRGQVAHERERRRPERPKSCTRPST